MPVFSLNQSNFEAARDLLARSGYDELSSLMDFFEVGDNLEKLENKLTSELEQGRSNGWASFRNGKLVGLVIIRRQITVERRHVLSLALLTDANERGSGGGGVLELLNAMLKSLETLSEYFRIEALVREDDLSVYNFLTQTGFAVEGVRRKSIANEVGNFVDEFLLAYTPSRH